MKPGDVVKIYQRPVTEEKLEGEAQLVKRVASMGNYDGRELGRWQVLFRGEGVYERNILEPEERIPRI